MILKAGRVVHVYGFPVQLEADVEVATHEGNWALIEAEHALATDRTGPGNARPDGSYGYPQDERLRCGPSSTPASAG